MVAELQALTVLWQSQLSYLKARDEIRMATGKVHLISDDTIRKIDETDTLYAHELPGTFEAAYGGALTAESDLRQNLSSLAFYKSQLPTRPNTSPLLCYGDKNDIKVRKDDDEDRIDVDENYDEEVECMICRDMLHGTEQKVCFLPCAHCYHEECVKEWIKYKPHCPFCKAKVSMKDICEYVEEKVQPRSPIAKAPNRSIEVVEENPSQSKGDLAPKSIDWCVTC